MAINSCCSSWDRWSAASKTSANGRACVMVNSPFWIRPTSRILPKNERQTKSTTAKLAPVGRGSSGHPDETTEVLQSPSAVHALDSRDQIEVTPGRCIGQDFKHCRHRESCGMTTKIRCQTACNDILLEKP